jgi:hypothetical protein
MFLTDAEIDAMCEGVTRNADKRRRLRAMGLIVNEKPNGRPLVVRSHAEAVLSGRKAAAVAEVAEAAAPAAFKPDREAYILKFSKKAA